MKIDRFSIREATASDVDAIAAAHRDSICSLGAGYYPADAVDHWQDGISGDLYLDAMARGEVFFVATAAGSDEQVIGFSSDYPIDDTTFGTSVYVRGIGARQGVGSALLRVAEAHAATRGATTIQIEASLAGMAFYLANGYVELRRGDAHLTSGHAMACVSMRKDLRTAHGAMGPVNEHPRSLQPHGVGGRAAVARRRQPRRGSR